MLAKVRNIILLASKKTVLLKCQQCVRNTVVFNKINTSLTITINMLIN